VPIIIHLLNRRKHQRVIWAAMRFVLAAIQKNQRRMNIEDLILLALRCLVLALLALAMARPTINAGAWLGRSAVTAVLVIDNSYSMARTDGAATRFEVATRTIADEIISSLPGGSSVGVVLASDVAQDLVPEPSYDLSFVRERIRRAEICDRGTNLLPAMQRAIRILENKQGARKEIYLITDGQATAWRQMQEIQQSLSDKKDAMRAHFVMLDGADTGNVGVSVLRMPSALAPLNRAIRFDVEVTNYGRTEAHDVPLRLFVNSDPASEETVIDRIAPGQSKSTSLFARFREEGFHTVTARTARDQLPRDDERSMVVRAIRQVRVLIVEGKPGREYRESESPFLRRALQPVEGSQRPDYYIQTRTVSPAELESTRPDDADVIILANVSDLSPQVAQATARAVREGAGLMIFLGDQANLPFYNDQFGKLSLLPATIGPAEGDATQDVSFWTYQSKDFTHPVTALWNDPASGNIGSVRTYRRYELTPVGGEKKAAAAGQPELGAPAVVLRYDDGKPAALERSYGLGRVVLFGGPASVSGSWNDLAVRPKVFVPLLHRLLGSMLARQEEYLNVRAGQKFIWRVSDELLGRDAMISRPGDREGTRDSRKVELSGGFPTLSYERTDVAGVYALSIAGDAGGDVRFAVQSDAQESRVEPLTPDQREQLARFASVTAWSPGVSVGDQLTSQRSGREIWLWFAIAAVMVAAAETYLAHKFSLTK
jgi:hypothetical protein